MATYRSGDTAIEVDEDNEAAFETAGWSRVDEPTPEKPPKVDK